MSGNITERNAKSVFSFLFFILLILFSISFSSSLANPASVYCEKMDEQFGGYETEIKNDKSGNQYGTCNIGRKEYNEWDFYSGKAGKEYSYCAKMGYNTEDIEGKQACADKKTGEIEFYVQDALNIEEETDYNLIASQEKLLAKEDNSAGPNFFKEVLKLNTAPLFFYNQSNYSYWDWRSPPNSTIWSNTSSLFFDNANGWMTSVKNQGACGSCWGFGIDGAFEAKYEINNNNSRLNPDLSEQYSVSCDHSCYAGYTYPNANCNTGCGGGWVDLALNYLTTSGTVDETCFPYITADGDCSSRCSDYSSRTWTLSGADYSGWYYDFTNPELEQWILDYGPVPIGMYMVDNADANGFINCGAGGNSNHAVVLVGYNDTGNLSTSYWILKNSWGSSYGVSGYIKIRFNDNCNVGDEVYYLNNTIPPNFKPSIYIASPSSNTTSANKSQQIVFNVTNRVFLNSTCDLIVDNSINQTNSTVMNYTQTSFSIELAEGTHNLSIRCWENKLGILETSASRSITIKNITITSLTPENNTFTNQNTSNFACASETSSVFSLKNVTFYIWNLSSSLVYNETKNISGISNTTSFNYSLPIEGRYYWSCLARNNESYSALLSSNNTLVYDISAPSITLISPSDSQSYSSNSQSINFQYNITENFEIANCSLIISRSFNLTNSTITNLSATQRFTQVFSPAAYSWSINCTDKANNMANSSSRNFTVSAPTSLQSASPSGGSSGGGGGGGATTKTYLPSQSQIMLGYNQELSKGDKIKFQYPNGENHTLEISGTGSTYVSLSLYSQQINTTILLNEEKKFSLSSPDYYDLSIKLNSIKESKTNITIKSIYEKIANFNQNNSSNQTTTKKNTNKTPFTLERTNNNVIYCVIAVIVLIAIVLLIAGISIYNNIHKLKKERKRR